MQKKDLGLLVLVLVIGAVTTIMNPVFLSPVNLVNMSNLIGLFGIFSLGQGLVIITGGIELSVGSMFALIGVIFIDLLVNYAVPWPLVVLIAIGLGLVFGAIHGFLVTRLGVQPFVVTLCGLLIYRGVARWYMADATIGFGYGNFDTLFWLMSGRSFGVPHTFIAFVVVAVIMWVVLHKSVFGRHLLAVGKNEEAARFSGINTRLVTASAYMINGALAGLTALFLAFYTSSVSPSAHGTFYELYAIAAAVLGGCSLTRRRRLDRRHRARHHPPADPAEPGQPPGHPHQPELRRDGHGHPGRRPGGSGVAEKAGDPGGGAAAGEGGGGGLKSVSVFWIRGLNGKTNS